MTHVCGLGLSPAQAEAVLDTRSQILVAAAAGSGKTRLLVAAIVKALVDEGLPVERLVAVTFTRKAGAELASRVREVLEACGRVDLARALDSAVLGTIHSLCRRLVKDQALAAGVDPGCRVLEAEAAELVKSEIAGKAWENAVDRASEEELGVLAARRVDIRKEMVVLYDRLRALGHGEPQIVFPGGSDEPKARAGLIMTVERALEAGRANPKQSKSLAEDLAKLRGCLDWLQGPDEERLGDGGLQRSCGFFPSRKSSALEEEFGAVRTGLAAYRCVLAESVLRPLAELMNAVLKDFHGLYSRHKAEQGTVDFADLELRARALLEGEARGERRTGLLSGSFLLVDEFQDTNELQCSILESLGATRVLMVGDERQSIYRFRGADVDVFRKRRVALDSGSRAGGSGGLHRLDVNYRSSRHILDFLNCLFSHASFFGQGFTELIADASRVAVVPEGAGAARAGGRCVDVLVASRCEEGMDDGARLVGMQQAEADALAAHVRGLLEREAWRQRDIVVLLPTQTQVEAYRDALSAQGIDVYLVRGKGYYSQEEVTDLTSLLRLLLNPYDDLAMLTVLRSPLVGVSDDALYLLGREKSAAGAGSLWEVLRRDTPASLSKPDHEIVDVFRERLSALRSKMGRAGLARFIDEALTTFSYDLCLLAAPEGRRRFANIRKLMRLASEYETVSGPDLAGFLSVIKSVGQLSDREGSAPTLGEGEDVVRVMTVHQAKGLEFPVVVLAGLGADSHRPETATFAVASDGRMGMNLRGYRNRTYEESDPHWGPVVEIAAEEAVKEQAEDVRLLYVAMTRAQERLVLVGARPTDDSLESSRIGRIVAALGLSSLPEEGETCLVDGLSVTVVGEKRMSGSGAVLESFSSAHEGDTRRARQVAKVGAPAPCVFPEPAKVTSPPAHLSFSSLAAYRRCPRQFYLQHVLGLAMDQAYQDRDRRGAAERTEASLDPEEAGSSVEVGILVHRMLEILAVDQPRPAVETVRKVAQEAVPRLGMQLPDADTERAVSLTMAAWESPLDLGSCARSLEREVPFFYAVGGTVMSGIMDLVCRGPESWLVCDYKTNALRGRTVKEVAEPYALQSVAYGLAALRAGAPAVSMHLLFLESPAEPVTSEYLQDDAIRMEREIVEAFSGMKAGGFPRQVGEACRHCAVRAVCAGMVADQAMV